MKKHNLLISFMLVFIFVACAYAKQFHEDVLINQDLTVSGNESVVGTLGVTGISTLGVVTITGNLSPQSTIVDPTITNFTNSGHDHENATGGATVDHGLALTGLGDDDHTIYNLLLGRAGGQTLIGGTASGDDLLLQSTSDGTKGSIGFGNLSTGMVFDETLSSLGIGLAAPDASALLDLTSTAKGFLGPRMDESQRDAIGSPATGLTVYNTDTNELNLYDGSSWGAIGGGGGAASTVLLTQPLRNAEDSIGATGTYEQKGQQILIGGDPITVTSVGFKVWDNISSGGTFSFAVRNCSVQSNSCTASTEVATSIETAPSTLGASLPADFVTIDMITPAVLLANTWYAVVVDASNVSTTIQASRRSDDVQPLVNHVSKTTGGGWGTFGNDYAFELNGTTGSANSYLSNVNNVDFRVPFEFGFLIEGVIRTQDNSVLNGDSRTITIETGAATGGGTANRGKITIDGPIMEFTDYATFELVDNNSLLWGAVIPQFIIDGQSTEATNAFASGIGFDGNGDQSIFTIFTKDVVGSTEPSADMNINTGYVSGTGGTGAMEFVTGRQTGASGNSGRLFFGTGNSTNGNSGNFRVNIGTAGGTQGEIKLLKNGNAPTVGDLWTATNVDGSGYWAAGPADFSNIAAFGFSDLMPNTWGTQLPALVYDGTTTEALAAFGAGDIFDGDGNQGSFFHFTKDISSGTAPSADQLIYTGAVSGTATGAVGNIEIITPSNSGPSGGAGKILIYSRDATNSADDGEIDLRVNTDGEIRFNHPSQGQAGEFWRTKDTLGNGNWENLQGRKVTADPCGDTTNYPESTIFYNDTSNYYCYCDGTNDVQMHSPATACF